MDSVSAVIKGSTLLEPSSTWIFVYFVNKLHITSDSIVHCDVRAVRKRVIQGKVSSKVVVTEKAGVGQRRIHKQVKFTVKFVATEIGLEF